MIQTSIGQIRRCEVPPLCCAYTSNLPPILERLGISLLVSTYQAGKLVVLRSINGQLDIQFQNFPKPMGLAVDQNRLAIGTTDEILEFHHAPATSHQQNDHTDGQFAPHSKLVTGDIAVHEMEWAGDELWFINTRCSCLCSRDSTQNFLPRWRPPFVSSLNPEDRCHLNGLAVVDGRPRFVTALGHSDDAGGWRENKAQGGILMEVPSGRIITHELSMPHSPRWYGGRLWILDSGSGGVGVIDPQSGHYEPVIELPGFTRGLDFCGQLAFIGLSQVRQSAVFSGVPITQRLAERTSGIWILDIITGETVATLTFEQDVQEIFAIKVLSCRTELTPFCIPRTD